MIVAFHGTTKQNANKILKSGFDINTYFARHLEDAIEFGGKYVFYVRFEEDAFDFDINNPEWWQFRTHEIVLPNCIWKLINFSPDTILDNSEVDECENSIL